MKRHFWGAALLRSDPRAEAAVDVLAKLLRNILANPTDPKYRKLRLNNKKIKEAIVDVSGGVEFLLVRKLNKLN